MLIVENYLPDQQGKHRGREGEEERPPKRQTAGQTGRQRDRETERQERQTEKGRAETETQGTLVASAASKFIVSFRRCSPRSMEAIVRGQAARVGPFTQNTYHTVQKHDVAACVIRGGDMKYPTDGNLPKQESKTIIINNS